MIPFGRMTPATADVLDALLTADGPVWGLKIVRVTARPAGSIYPILGRLERAGWALSHWDEDADRAGPRRRLYQLADGAVAPARAISSEFRERESQRLASSREALA